MPRREDLRRHRCILRRAGPSRVQAAVSPGPAFGAAAALMLGTPGFPQQVDGSPVATAAAIGAAAIGAAAIAVAAFGEIGSAGRQA